MATLLTFALFLRFFFLLAEGLRDFDRLRLREVLRRLIPPMLVCLALEFV